MENIIPFNFSGKKIRVCGTPENPLFVATDVCSALEIRNSRDALKSLDEDEKGVALTDTLGGKQELAAVSESGLYHLIFKSRKASAKRFRKWVTEEVLPTIRRTGSYRQPAKLPTCGDLARMVLDQEHKLGLTVDVMDKILPTAAYGSLTPSGSPRVGFRRASFVAAAHRLHDAARLMATAAQLELDMLVDGRAE